MTTLVKQAAKHLLIDPHAIAIREDRGITWVTDRYTCARVDLFKRPPTRQHPQVAKVFTSRRLRELLSRRPATLGDPLRDTMLRGHGRLGAEFAVVTDGVMHVAINAHLWQGHQDAWLKPYLGTASTPSVCWFATVRGKPALYAVTALMRVEGGHLRNLRAVSP